VSKYFTRQSQLSEKKLMNQMRVTSKHHTKWWCIGFEADEKFSNTAFRLGAGAI
jgi:hypothetical protein